MVANWREKMARSLVLTLPPRPGNVSSRLSPVLGFSSTESGVMPISRSRVSTTAWSVPSTVPSRVRPALSRAL